jgi:DNA-binding NarL/FixJ family response regulator
MTTYIVLGDDHPLVRVALRDTIEAAIVGATVTGCASLDEVIDVVARDPHTVSLVLLDLNMSGFAGLFLMQTRFPTVAVAIVSATETDGAIRRALTYGAAGYIPKSMPTTLIAEAIEAILNGTVWTPPGWLEEAPGEDVEGAEDADFARRFAALSGQQIRILTSILAGKLNKQIAADLGIAEQTVKAHVSVILKKLGVGSRTRAAVLAGALLPDAPAGMKDMLPRPGPEIPG